jgi:hypothetical protein
MPWDSVVPAAISPEKHELEPLSTTIDKLAPLEPALTEAEIDAEISAALAERSRLR